MGATDLTLTVSSRKLARHSLGGGGPEDEVPESGRRAGSRKPKALSPVEGSAVEAFLIGRPAPAWQRAVRFLPAIIVMGAIFYLSSQSKPPGHATARAVVGARNATEGLGHAVIFAALGLALWWGIGSVVRTTWRALLLTWVGCAVYGALDEFHQTFVPHRTASMADWAYDVLGAAVACAVVATGTIIVHWLASRRPHAAT